MTNDGVPAERGHDRDCLGAPCSSWKVQTVKAFRPDRRIAVREATERDRGPEINPVRRRQVGGLLHAVGTFLGFLGWGGLLGFFCLGDGAIR